MTVSETEKALSGSPSPEPVEPVERGNSIQMLVTKEDQASLTEKKSGSPYLVSCLNGTERNDDAAVPILSLSSHQADPVIVRRM